MARAVHVGRNDGDVLLRAGRATANDQRPRASRAEPHRQSIADLANEERGSEVRHGGTVRHTRPCSSRQRAVPNYVHAVKRRLRWLLAAGAVARGLTACGGGAPIANSSSASSRPPLLVPHGSDESTTTPFLLTTTTVVGPTTTASPASEIAPATEPTTTTTAPPLPTTTAPPSTTTPPPATTPPPPPTP